MKYRLAAILLMGVAFFWAGAALITADETPRMTKEELKGMLGDADLVVVDVRAGGSWTDSASKIKGAVREDPAAVQNWVQKYPKDKTLVFYCS
jgi:rhodanese-related sulfurtransferase